MQGIAPSLGYFKQVLEYNLAMHLGQANDLWDNWAVNQELAELWIIRVCELEQNIPDDWVSHSILNGKQEQLCTDGRQCRAEQQDVALEQAGFEHTISVAERLRLVEFEL